MSQLPEQPPSTTEAVIGLICVGLCVVMLFMIFASCGGCWDSGTRLFWH